MTDVEDDGTLEDGSPRPVCMLIGDGYAIKGDIEEEKGDKKALRFDGEKLKDN